MNAYIDQINSIDSSTSKSAAWVNYYSNWLSAPNRSVRTSYFTEATSQNPSGNANVESISYWQGEFERAVVYFAWDSSDNVTEQRNYPFS